MNPLINPITPHDSRMTNSYISNRECETFESMLVSIWEHVNNAKTLSLVWQSGNLFIVYYDILIQILFKNCCCIIGAHYMSYNKNATC